MRLILALILLGTSPAAAQSVAVEESPMAFQDCLASLRKNMNEDPGHHWRTTVATETYWVVRYYVGGGDYVKFECDGRVGKLRVVNVRVRG